MILAAVGCSNPSGGGATGPTVSSISGQQSDLPSGMLRCPTTGKLEDFIKVVLTQAIGSQQFYIAEWQNKKFMVIPAVLNIDPESSKKVSTAENGRIR